MHRFKSYMKDFGFATVCALLLTLMYVSDARATDVTLSWTLPTLNCDGSDIVQPLGSLEIYVSEVPIPSTGAACSEPAENPPAGFTPVSVAAGSTTITVDLEAGKTYFFRSRVQGAGGGWSNLSNEATHIIPFLQVQPPTVLIIG